jgi:hypothetical protein
VDFLLSEPVLGLKPSTTFGQGQSVPDVVAGFSPRFS